MVFPCRTTTTKKSDNATLMLLIQYYQDEAKSKENQSIIISTMIKINNIVKQQWPNMSLPANTRSATLFRINTF